MQSTHKQHGGQRKNAGRKVRLNLHFSIEDAKSIRQLTKHRRAESGNRELTEEQVVIDLVEAAWQEIIDHYEEGAELAAEGETYIL